MLPRKPYAFVCFLCEEEAEAAYNALNGYKLEATEERKEEITLYISYVRQGISFRGQNYFNISLTVFTCPADICTCPLKVYAIKNIRK